MGLPGKRMRLHNASLLVAVLLAVIPKVSTFDVSIDTRPLCEGRLPGSFLGPPLPETGRDPVYWIRGDPERSEDLNRIGTLIHDSYPRYLGLAYDIEGERIVMGVDPDASLEEAAEEIAGVMSSDLDVVVQPGCYSRASQAPIREQLDRELGEDPQVLGGISIGIDGRLEVFFLPQLSEDEVEAIALDLYRRYGDRLIVPRYPLTEAIDLEASKATSPPSTPDTSVPVARRAEKPAIVEERTTDDGDGPNVPETAATAASDEVPDAAGPVPWLIGSAGLVGAAALASIGWRRRHR